MSAPRLLLLRAGGQHRPAAQPDVSEPVPEVVASPESTPEPVEPPEPVVEMRMGTADQIENAQRFAKAGVPMRLVDPEHPHETHMVGPDLAQPELWRHTTLVDDEPWSDQEFTAAEDAFLSALRAGGLPAA